MTQYRKLIIAATTLIAGMGLTSCDDILTSSPVIPENDRYIEGEAIEAERKVLLVDFTGQNCINCPEAHKVIEQLEEQYEDDLIAVSVHCGSFGISVKRTNFDVGRIGLMTDEGNAIMETFGIDQFPMGCIDFGSPLEYTGWATGVRDALQKPTDVTIDLKATYVKGDEDDGEAYYGTIKIDTEVMCSENRAAKLQVWVVESGIVAEQRTLGSQTIQDYVHNNVFRAQLYDGLKGMDINLKSGIVGEYQTEIASRWTNKEHWNVKNMAVIAIVSDGSGVIQVERVPVTVE